MLKLGIIGYPLEHSLSPVMHTAALQYLNISGSYRAFETKKDELEKIFNQLKDSGLKGFNVTIPHKTTIIPLLDELTETAKLVGAVNTVTFTKDKKSIGDNTDVTGFWEPIPEDIKTNIPNQTISILGCGGAALAVATALVTNKVKHLKIYGRDLEKLYQFKKLVSKTNETLKGETTIETGLLINIDLSNSSMLVNTTPIGRFPDIDNSPVLKQELRRLPGDAFVYDIVYNPSDTLLLQYARSLSLKTLNGIEMLIRQGAASLAIWLEQDISHAPLGAMRLALTQCIKDQHNEDFAE